MVRQTQLHDYANNNPTTHKIVWVSNIQWFKPLRRQSKLGEFEL